MTINDQIRDENLQYDINREAAKISALSSGRIHKYEYLTGEDILPSNQQQIIEQRKLTYSPLGKAFDKQIKTIEDQGQKQIKAFAEKVLISFDKKNEIVQLDKLKEILCKFVAESLKEIEKLQNSVNFENLIYYWFH